MTTIWINYKKSSEVLFNFLKTSSSLQNNHLSILLIILYYDSLGTLTFKNLNFSKRNFMAPFVDGVQLSQLFRATIRRQFTFYH